MRTSTILFGLSAIFLPAFAQDAAASSTTTLSSISTLYPMTNGTITASATASGFATLVSGAPSSSGNLSITASRTFSNSTMTAPASTAISSDGAILVASGTPTVPAKGPNTVTSMVVVTPSVAVTAAGSSASAASSSSTSASDRLATPGILLGLVALGACILG
ncbi:hypothetical protein PVAG01_10344 [Phlyctema vagabunda]|uniref:Uncharacterized protein n=1 Tax=Phlyctema vagabunda TaxID=108571 RepID=A0ABR4P5R7_9HELO